ncbi:ABC transporter ATP-binding protein [Galbitalea sp. SE-J8]|uniref:dipeptide ABC transporter ATP-binding protein n=1 Tax=Galbitalea sp. SE-J8 TaxID=3054952 RepID=UPI00259D200F|nr:ABC transporter ATP-binding protein [Galbitalea sp. SE-J8]MDM4761587.1 ABC transporter ATP-binding protein [Galbitalea sp. SE-J8]
MSALEPALVIEGLTVDYRSARTGTATALEPTALTVGAGEVVALVGESGSGKTTLGMAAIGLLAPNALARFDRLELGGTAIRDWTDPLWRSVRGTAVSLVPQDPSVSLNPVRTIGSQATEHLVLHGLARPHEARARLVDLLREVGFDEPERRLGQYPHELSGGQQQRVLLAMAFSSDPKLIVADEPTSGLDVTVQRAVLDRLDLLRAEHGTAILFITHDLGVAVERADRIVVLQNGRIVEEGPALAVATNPQHEYTRSLLAAAPSFASGRLVPSPGTAPAPDAKAPDPAAVLVVDDVRKAFVRGRHVVQALDGVSLAVGRGRTLGIVGESGSGKSTLARVLVGLEHPDSGTVEVHGEPVPRRGARALRAYRDHVQLIYQNPYASLDPRFSVVETIAEPLRNYRSLGRAELRARVDDALDAVALPRALGRRRPHELSGGQRQRVALARGIVLRPDLLVLDEPVSALDVSVQAQILQLLVDLQAEYGLSYAFITHDLAVVRQIADEVAVVARGRVVETGSVEAVFDRPAAAETIRLIEAIPGRRTDAIAI